MAKVGAPSEDQTAVDGAPVDDGTDVATEVVRAESLSFTRGMNTRAAVAWVRQRHGEAGVKQLRAALPHHLVDELGGEALRPGSMTWVPFLAHARLLETIDSVFGNGDLRVMRDVGRFMAAHDLPALARPMARLLSPGLFVDMSVKIWRLYNSHGHWEILRSPRHVQASLFARPETHRAFCEGTMGWLEGAMLFCGAIDVVAIEDRCVARGAPCCSINVRWSEAKDAVAERRPRPPT